MGRLIQILVIAAAVYVGYRLLRGLFAGGGAGSQLPCATCANCKALYDDGVICMFGAKETFKKEMHIANCGDYRRRGA